MAIFDPRLAVRPSSIPPPRSFPVTQFGGLNLAADAEDVGWSYAVDLLNVDIDRGVLRSRDGVARRGSGTATGTTAILWAGAYGTSAAVLSNTTSSLKLDIFSTAGTVTDSEAWAYTASTPAMAVTFGTPTSTLLFAASIGTTLRKYDGTSAAASVGKPRLVAVTPQSNRLVQAGFSAAADSPTGANGSTSTVFFSNQGAPETFSANDYVLLRPGDGEDITAMVAWQSYLFVWKQTKLYVFYGETTDAAGDTEFSYREIDADCPNAQAAVTATPGGVYWIGTNGVYLTTGGTPERVSDPVQPLFSFGNAALPYPYLTNIPPRSRASWVAGRLHLTDSSAANPVDLVFDPVARNWLIWTYASLSGAPLFEVPGAGHPFLIGANRGLYWFTGDCEQATSYRTGFADLGSPAAEKTLREILFDGFGTLTVSVATNDGTLDSGTSVALGTSPTVAQGRHRRAYRGRNFSLQVATSSSAANPWEIRRLVPTVINERRVGLKSG